MFYERASGCLFSLAIKAFIFNKISDLSLYLNLVSKNVIGYVPMRGITLVNFRTSNYKDSGGRQTNHLSQYFSPCVVVHVPFTKGLLIHYVFVNGL